eukprot:11949015-Alexandrium_andersonii.AAC.1
MQLGEELFLNVVLVGTVAHHTQGFLKLAVPACRRGALISKHATESINAEPAPVHARGGGRSNSALDLGPGTRASMITGPDVAKSDTATPSVRVP